MVELVTSESLQRKPLADLITDVFERRVSGASVKKERRLIIETYGAKFQELVETLPVEKRDTTAIELQKIFVKLTGVFSEYGARFGDFVNNLINWPMIRVTPDFPKDKYYQIGLARAKAWGGFGRDTTKTATAERKAFRDHFLPLAVIGGEVGALAGGALSVPLAIGVGAAEGARFGLLAGAAGVAGGALLGATIGGISALVLRYKDRIIGEPVVYYNLFGSASSGSSSSVYMSSGGGGSVGGDMVAMGN